MAAAGPAALHDAISEQFGVAEDLPCADSGFLAPLKRSPEFRALRPRLAGRPPHPVYGSWLDDDFHFFVFRLAAQDDQPGDPGLAVFAMHPQQHGPVSAVTVVPTEDTTEAEITNVADPTNSYRAPLRETT